MEGAVFESIGIVFGLPVIKSEKIYLKRLIKLNLGLQLCGLMQNKYC